MQKDLPHNLFSYTSRIILLCVVFATFTSLTHTTYAQTTSPTPGVATATQAPSGSGAVATPGTTAGSKSAPTADTVKSATKDTKKSNFDEFMATLDLPNAIGRWAGNQILATASAITFMGGKALEYTLDKLVFNMGSLINDQGFGTAIDMMWRLIRDISNLIFIFAFVYVGIYLIIDPEKISAKRMLAQTIIGALLINFSLFFVKFIIDFANFTSLQIFKAMTTGSGSISQKIADMLGIAGLLNAADSDTLAKLTSGGYFWFFILGSLLLLVAAFVFFTAAFMMLTRFVGLVLIMVASPILFAGIVFPGTQKFAKELWSKLIAYAFYAPAFLLLILISITLLQGFQTGLPNTASMTDALMGKKVVGSYDSFAVIMNFIVVIFFFIQALQLADKMGLAGADMAVKVGGSLTVGLTAKMGRATVGRVAHDWSQSEELKDKASQGGVSGWAARQRLKVYNTAGDASFDLRNSKANKGLKLGLGEGRKGGYATVKKEVEAKEMKFAKSLGEIDDEDMLVHARKDAMEEARKNLNRNRDRLKKEEKFDELEKLEKDVADAEKNYNQEKNRRVLGGTYIKGADENKLKVQKDTLTAQSKNIKSMLSRLQNSTDQKAREFLEEEIKKSTEAYSQARKQLDAQSSKESGTRGYASVLTDGTFAEGKHIKTWMQGRLVAHERAAGEAMEKAFTKKIKKSKEEKDKDALIDAVKESGSSK